ncbi:hypothetical protein [Halococcus thailandensis]|jgi:hypothetical protein|uniref:Uncharacterized protein n=1 Tax=Halococcus thailandensis JCM 13552 TaxID=1227457 RepID=M0NHQ7_9EURY|nr:hypothetical protein [Halococcus thailandensis]EMA56644.1 hypothetical protein C451_01438 [Halococcus thailandensis JCM 13552]
MSDNTRHSETSLSSEIEGADEAVVTFHPQIWHDNRALTSDDTETYTVPVEAALDDNGELLEDDTGESDALATHENAPERAQNWSENDPYYVTIDGLR